MHTPQDNPLRPAHDPSHAISSYRHTREYTVRIGSTTASQLRLSLQAQGNVSQTGRPTRRAAVSAPGLSKPLEGGRITHSLPWYAAHHQAARWGTVVPGVGMRRAILILHPEAALAEKDLAAPSATGHIVIDGIAIVIILPRLWYLAYPIVCPKT